VGLKEIGGGNNGKVDKRRRMGGGKEKFIGGCERMRETGMWGM